MKRIRTEIESGGFQKLYEEMKTRWSSLDLHALAPG
jgi:hypothetical protein